MRYLLFDSLQTFAEQIDELQPNDNATFFYESEQKPESYHMTTWFFFQKLMPLRDKKMIDPIVCPDKVKPDQLYSVYLGKLNTIRTPDDELLFISTDNEMAGIVTVLNMLDADAPAKKKPIQFILKEKTVPKTVQEIMPPPDPSTAPPAQSISPILQTQEAQTEAEPEEKEVTPPNFYEEEPTPPKIYSKKANAPTAETKESDTPVQTKSEIPANGKKRLNDSQVKKQISEILGGIDEHGRYANTILEIYKSNPTLEQFRLKLVHLIDLTQAMMLYKDLWKLYESLQ